MLSCFDDAVIWLLKLTSIATFIILQFTCLSITGTVLLYMSIVCDATFDPYILFPGVC